MADDSVTTAKHCSKCGVPVGPNGLCPVCLLHRALSDESRILFAPGTTFGHFRIVRVIGKGGMGIVYEAADDLHRAVALKVLPEEYLDDERIASMFKKEAEWAAGLDHPSIVVIYNRGTNDGIPWISMRLLEGGDLGTLLQSSRLTSERSIAILKQVASALDYAHARKVVHRDIKPTNILFDRDGNAYVADFGLARTISDSTFVSSFGVVVGTPMYMAPEQARGARVTAACDVYSLGKVADEMLSASVGSNAPSTLPQGMRAAIHKAMTNNPQERWTSAGEFVKALDAALPRKSGKSWWLGLAASLAAVVVVWSLLGDPASDANPGAVTTSPAPISVPGGDPNPPLNPPIPDDKTEAHGRETRSGSPRASTNKPPIQKEPEATPENGPAASSQPTPPQAPPYAVAGGEKQPSAPIGTGPVDAPPVESVRKPDQVIPPRLLTAVKPNYPAIARVGGWSGDVVLTVFVGVDGHVLSEKTEVRRGRTRVLDEAARRAVQSYRYLPGRRNGVPEVMSVEETVTFKLD